MQSAVQVGKKYLVPNIKIWGLDKSGINIKNIETILREE